MLTDLDHARFCDASENNPVGFDFIDDGTGTGIFFAINKLPDFDIITFRGSVDPEDFLRDGFALMTAVTGIGRFHAGFWQNMPKVIQKIIKLTQKNVIIRGHSLGAARAAQCAGFLQSYGLKKVVEAVLFGCPRPADQKLADVLSSVPVTSYRNGQDPVTEVPLYLPDFEYVNARKLIQIEGLADEQEILDGPVKWHHIKSYIKALENFTNGNSETV